MMIKQKLILLGLCTIITYCTYGMDSQRTIMPLNDGWMIKPITSTAKGATLVNVSVPHTWNANYISGTTAYNRETMVYYHKLYITPEMDNKRIFLYFEGVNSVADIFVNKRSVGTHKGGYTAFCLEITNIVHHGENELEVWASNAFRADVLPLSGDFNVYGGIHRPCYMIVTEKNCISPVFFASPGVFIHQDDINVKKAELTIESILSLKGDRNNLTLKTTISDYQGKLVKSEKTDVKTENVKQHVHLENPILWDGKNNPYLYNIIVELYENGQLVDKVIQHAGLRYFHVDRNLGFFLNGRHYDLHGFCRHEDVKGKGSALQDSDYQKDMNLINESGATAMRLAHYPHAKRMYDLSDENGIVIMTEIPLCGPGGYDFTGYIESVRENALQVTKELVYQNYNHPSICFWGLFNEILVTDKKKFASYDDPIPVIKEINKLIKSLDSTRLTTFATCVDQTKYFGCSDIIAWNKYFGWYEGMSNEVGSFFDDVREHSNNQPVGVSEYGAGASIHHHLMPNEKVNDTSGRFHPEEKQADCHEENWEAFSKRDYLWGKFIWCFADFQSAERKEGDKDGINDKGLITYDREIKKDAFYFYKANWNKNPMLYITSRRYTERKDSISDIKIYSNLKKVTLYVNGNKIGTSKPDKMHRVIWKNIVLIPGDNTIKADGKAGHTIFTDFCKWHLQKEKR